MSRRHTDVATTVAGSSSSVLMSLHDPDAEAFAILNQGEGDGKSHPIGDATTSGSGGSGGGGGGGGSLRSLGRVSSSVVPQSLMAFEVSGFEKVGGTRPPAVAQMVGCWRSGHAEPEGWLRALAFLRGKPCPII